MWSTWVQYRGLTRCGLHGYSLGSILFFFFNRSIRCSCLFNKHYALVSSVSPLALWLLCITIEQEEDHIKWELIGEESPRHLTLFLTCLLLLYITQSTQAMHCCYC